MTSQCHDMMSALLYLRDAEAHNHGKEEHPGEHDVVPQYVLRNHYPGSLVLLLIGACTIG